MTQRTFFPRAMVFVLGALVGAACSSSNNGGDGAVDGQVDVASDVATSDALDASDATDAASDAADASADAANDAADASADGDAGATDAGPVDAGPPVWHQPMCGAAVASQGSVTYSLDEGSTLAPIDTRPVGISYTFALAALDTPNTLVAEHAGKVIRSTDAGCTWTQIGTVDHFPLTMAAAPGGRAYAFQDNESWMYRVDGDVITALTSPAMYIVGLGVDPHDGMHVRIGDTDGHQWESADGGATWVRHGTPVPIGTDPVLVYRYAYDPNDLDHVLVGLSGLGAFESDDGGENWTPVDGLAAHQANVFSIVISPADSHVVWMQGIDLDHTDDPVSSGRWIWRSTDRGLNATPVVTQSASVVIRNQELLAAHPTNTNVLYFVFGTYFQNYGTDVYRYDANTGEVKISHNDYNDVNAIAFSPADPSVMYLGITWDAHQ